ncbi:Dolichyl-diphosphooligosaccharide--protein glycosyltransferase subunit STT3B [Vitis vinifera]|uniref:dolichyl-diphosphooligosaccharide--protein glycotransferase n=1 Tax=Vitis vinifera TaxID=29760 RepID=A0A438DBM2_VITVI|nr:Dolichyl-diphosphooligosaccharide--protein glycosyltransferase subunit STT3B [Vitis vinifera]
MEDSYLIQRKTPTLDFHHNGGQNGGRQRRQIWIEFNRINLPIRLLQARSLPQIPEAQDQAAGAPDPGLHPHSRLHPRLHHQALQCPPLREHDHEFDPYFNYRTTVFLTEKGFYEFWNWFDSESWYPLGRIIGGTLYPGLMVTAALIYSIIRFLRFAVHIREVCVLTAPFFASNTTIVAYFFGKELWDSGAGLVAAALIAICPGYISRSVAGSYDNEGVAIFALLLTFYLFVKAVNTGSLAWALASAFGYFYMVSAWGGYVFIINLIPLYAMVLLITGRYSMRLYVAYNCMYILGMLLAMQIRFVGFQHVQSGEHMAAMGVFFLMQVSNFPYIHMHKIVHYMVSIMDNVLRSTIFAVGVGAIALGVGTASGYISPWTGRFYSLLDPTYAKDHIPIIASVSEHQPTAWSSFMFDFHILLFLFPAGLYFCFKRLSDATIFIVMYGLTSMYFAGVMVRLILVATPAMCLISAIAVSATIKNLTQLVRTKSKVAHTGSTKGTTSGKASSKVSSSGKALPVPLDFWYL